MTQIQPNIDRHEFIETIFETRTADEHVCVSRANAKSDGSGMWFSNHLEADRAWRKWNSERHAQAWYYNVSTISGEMNDKGTMVSRGRANLMRYHVLVLDDIGQKTGEPPVEPSYKLESSVGSFQWGYLLEPGSDFDRYEALVAGIHKLGFGDAGAGGSYRLVRVVGSANMKPGRDEFRSRITEWAPDRLWTLDELVAAFGVDMSDVASSSPSVRAAAAGAEAMEGIDPMLVWLSDNGHVVRDGGQWVDVVCPWAHAHTSGANTAGYSPLGRGSGPWVERRSFSCKHEHCSDKHITDLVKWSVEQDGPFVSGYDPLPWLQSRYAYVQFGQQVADMDQRPKGGVWMWSLADWTKAHPGAIMTPGRKNPVTVATAFVEHDDTDKAVSVRYDPVRAEDDDGLCEAHGQLYVNTYVPPQWAETHETPQVFLDHVEYLLPKEDEREIFLNWLAYKIQNPLSRSYATVMVTDGTQGTGRSWLKKLLSATLQGHVETASLPQLVGLGTSAEQTYNDWMAGCQFLVVEEAKDSSMSRTDFYAAYETFKSRVDTSVLKDQRINPKYGRTRNENIYFNALIFTNHVDAIAFPKEDRRIFAVENPTKTQTYEYYERLAASLTGEEPARVYWWLMRRDVSGYDHIYPPMTPTKEAMIDANVAPSDAILDWVVDNYSPDLLTRSTLRTQVMLAANALDYERLRREPGDVGKRIWRKIKTLRPGDTKHGARISHGGKRVEVRAIRRRAHWQGQTVESMAEHLEHLEH